VPDKAQSPTVRGKFLIVDDHAAFRQTLRAFLPDSTVLECADGREVLALYAAERPDWVLMDIQMPGLDGLTATRRLKEKFPAARIIIVTNHAGEEFRAAARDAGADGFVHKEHLEELPAMVQTKGPSQNL
jgi:CheY-like chemotaxis protein